MLTLINNRSANKQHMPKLRYLRVGFDTELNFKDIKRFRAAVIEKTERVSTLFHNHLSGSAVIYRYPLIQYKIIKNKAAIICLETGTDDIHHLLKHRDLDLRIGNKIQSFQIGEVLLNYFNTSIVDNSITYNLDHWIPLNQKHFEVWKKHKDDKLKQIKLLESILLGNILSFAKGINWFIEEKVVVDILKVNQLDTVDFKQHKQLSISLIFKSNILIPDFIGLGKGSSIGFGMVEKTTKNQLDE